MQGCMLSNYGSPKDVVKLWKTIEASLMQKIVIKAIKCNKSINIAFECKRFNLDTKTLHLLQMLVYN